MQPDDPALTVDEVARELRVRPATIRTWLRQGRLQGFQIGPRKAWRIRRSDVRRFEESQRG